MLIPLSPEQERMLQALRGPELTIVVKAVLRAPGATTLPSYRPELSEKDWIYASGRRDGELAMASFLTGIPRQEFEE